MRIAPEPSLRAVRLARMAAEEIIAIEFVADVQDVEASTLHAFTEYTKSQSDRLAANRSKSKRLERIIYLVLSCISVVYLVAVVWGGREPSFVIICLAPIGPILFGLTFLNVAPKKMDEALKREAHRAARAPGARCAYGRYKVSVEQAGFRYVGEQLECLHRWPMVIKVGTDDSALYVEFVNYGTFRIPFRAFPDDASRQRFVDAINSRISTLGFDMSTRILAYAKEKNARCPGCSYPLADLVSLRCPECGRAPTLNEFPEAAHMMAQASPRT